MSVMTDRTVAALCFAVFACALTIGYVWGRVNSRRTLDAAFDEGYATGLDAQDAHITKPRPVLAADRPPEGREPAGPGQPDWREQTAAELAPDALAADDVLLPGGVMEGQQVRQDADVPGQAVMPRAGQGHPSPYGGNLTAAQRRRDKHKQRGQYAPGLAEIGWVDRQLYENAITRARIEAFEHAEMEAFHADVARVDDQIARWGDWARESLTPQWTRFERMVST
jgi:hypothetical protein